jgi:hypothetical protein
MQHMLTPNKDMRTETRETTVRTMACGLALMENPSCTCSVNPFGMKPRPQNNAICVIPDKGVNKHAME